MHETITIGDLAREFGVTLRTLRFYEDCGLLKPRRQGQSRLYVKRDRARLKLILTGKRVGFSLAEIRDMLASYDLRDGQPEQLSAALDKFNAQIDYLRRQREDVDDAIDQLTRTVRVVSGMLESRRSAEAPMAAGE